MCAWVRGHVRALEREKGEGEREKKKKKREREREREREEKKKKGEWICCSLRLNRNMEVTMIRYLRQG